MSKAHPPELKKFMDKRIHLRINGSRQVRCSVTHFEGFSINCLSRLREPSVGLIHS